MGDGLYHMGYIDMCNPKGYVFYPFWSEIGYRFWPFWSGLCKKWVGRYTKLLQFSTFVQLPLSFDFGLSTFLLSNERI